MEDELFEWDAVSWGEAQQRWRREQWEDLQRQDQREAWERAQLEPWAGRGRQPASSPSWRSPGRDRHPERFLGPGVIQGRRTDG